MTDKALVRMVRLSDRSPVWGCIGPRTALSAGELQDGFQAFYREMLDSADLRKAIEALGGGLPGVGKPFVLWPAEYFFLVAYRGYLERECTDQRIAERVDWIANHLLLRAAGRVEKMGTDLFSVCAVYEAEKGQEPYQAGGLPNLLRRSGFRQQLKAGVRCSVQHMRSN